MEQLTDHTASFLPKPSIQALNRAVLAADTLDTWRQASLKALSAGSGARVVGLFLLSPARTNLVLQGVEGERKNLVYNLDLLVNRTAESPEQAVSVRNPTGAPLLIFPILAKQEMIGAVVLVEPPPGAPMPDDWETCLALVGMQYQLLHYEQVVAQQMSQNNAIADNLPIGIFIMERQGQLVYGNASFAKMVGKGITELAGLPLATLLGPGEKGQFDKSTRQVWEGGQRKVSEAFLTLNGRRMFVQVGTLLIRSMKGHPQMLGYVVDLNDRKRTEEALELARAMAVTSDRAKDEFVSMMSHEARTPLNSIIGNAYLLLDQNPSPAQLGPVNSLRLAADHLLALLNDVLDFSQIQQGTIEITPINFSLDNFLDKIYQNFSAKATEANLVFHLDRAPNLPKYVSGDSLRLSQILGNVLGFVFKSTAASDICLTISHRKLDFNSIQLNFEIRDISRPMPNDQLDNLFLPFAQVRLDQEGEDRFGLGLAIAKELAEVLGGHLTIDRLPDEITVCRLEVPLHLPTAPADADELDSNLALNGQFADFKVLLAEDIQGNQLIVSRFLTQWGIAVDLAPDGLVALHKSYERTYDLILMDLQMPNMDGWESARQIRENPLNPCSEIPIVALTADVSVKTRDRLLNAGFTDVLAKPITPLVLYQQIDCLFPTHLPKMTTSLESAGSTQPKPDYIADYLFIEKAAEGDAAFLALMLSMAANEFEEISGKFAQAIEMANVGEARRLKHKIMPHLESYKLLELDQLFVQATDLLTNVGTQETVTQMAQEISRRLAEVCHEFRDRVGALENVGE